MGFLCQLMLIHLSERSNLMAILPFTSLRGASKSTWPRNLFDYPIYHIHIYHPSTIIAPNPNTLSQSQSFPFWHLITVFNALSLPSQNGSSSPLQNRSSTTLLTGAHSNFFFPFLNTAVGYGPPGPVHPSNVILSNPPTVKLPSPHPAFESGYMPIGAVTALSSPSAHASDFTSQAA
jgi:hypothetical protein